MPANTGVAGACHRVAFFAGLPAPTGLLQALVQAHHQPRVTIVSTA